MLFWNTVVVGDGVGEGVVACEAGATTSRIVMMAPNTAPTAFNNLPRLRCNVPLGVLLKIKNLRLGGDRVAPLQPLRTMQATKGWCGTAMRKP